ncbi:hypothetical protein JW992_16545 [candidate division KSB1 bacterium]|nr:hypothetical protein [candidate division KSB1 bacterium]
MNRPRVLQTLWILLFSFFLWGSVFGADWRWIETGREIPSRTYADQPYVVPTDDGAWLCCLTTGAGHEGHAGQHVISLRSSDQGRTWSEPVAVEPADGPEASYAVMLKIPSGRIYIFYNHNSDNLRRIKADDPPYPGGWCERVDSQGYFVLKYSDDHGRSWSTKRYSIPVREFEIDRQNPYGGAIRFFWNVGKPFLHQGKAYVPLTKVGGIGAGFFTRNEGVLLCSDNLLVEPDPNRIRWETLPQGEIGLRTPPGGGPIAAEQSYAVLSDGSFYCIYRSLDGHPVVSISRDQGKSWSEPRYLTYADGRRVKHPRAANFVWKCSNGNYLYWFHNHGGRFIRQHPDPSAIGYNDRNPAWLCGGIEYNTAEGMDIRWSEPEILLYDDDVLIRMSYPDLIEERGEYFVTETQKDIARVHRLDPQLLQGLWRQFESAAPVDSGRILEWRSGTDPMPRRLPLPTIDPLRVPDWSRPDFASKSTRKGFSIALRAIFSSFDPGQILLDNRLSSGKGFCLRTAKNQTVELVLNDGRQECVWSCDPGILQLGRSHPIVAVVDGGPRIISFIIDGKLGDGGDHRQFGWGRFSPTLLSATGADSIDLAPAFAGTLEYLAVYNRALRTSEAVSLYRNRGVAPVSQIGLEPMKNGSLDSPKR